MITHFPRKMIFVFILCLSLLISSACGQANAPAEPITLRLEVSLTPQELATLQPAIQAIDEAHH